MQVAGRWQRCECWAESSLKRRGLLNRSKGTGFLPRPSCPGNTHTHTHTHTHRHTHTPRLPTLQLLLLGTDVYAILSPHELPLVLSLSLSPSLGLVNLHIIRHVFFLVINPSPVRIAQFLPVLKNQFFFCCYLLVCYACYTLSG